MARRRLLKELGRTQAAQRAAGLAVAWFLRLVWATSRRTREPADYATQARAQAPIICAMWHGQHLLTPLAVPRGMKFAVLISRHRDGEVQATTIRSLGMAVVRGSGGRSAADYARKGGAGAFREMARLLAAGTSISITADVPKGPARVCGAGVILLARRSGRPIVPVAVASRRRRTFWRSWDRAALNLPFSRVAVVVGAPIFVPRDAADPAPWQAQVKAGLDALTRRAYALVGACDAFDERPLVAANPRRRDAGGHGIPSTGGDGGGDAGDGGGGGD